MTLPLRIGCLRALGLLAFGSGNAALDGEGGAIGARHTEAGGIASYLNECYAALV